MIDVTRLNARGCNGNGDAVVDYLLATEYYTNGQGHNEEMTRWTGKLADDPDLQLLGKAVTKADMLQLAKGYSPAGMPLCQNAGEEPVEIIKLDRHGKPKLDKEGNVIKKLEGGHRVGFDITMSAPKPASILFALAEGKERDAILDAHRKAVDVALAYMEDKVETRRDKGGKTVIGTQGLVVMQADHLASRNLDMQLHTHCLAFGVTKGVDGKWGTFDAKELYTHKRAADIVYKNELMMNLRELGFSMHQERQLDVRGRETGAVLYKVNGISDELCKVFSSRREEILAYQAEHGVDAQTACLATRRHKDEPTFAEMQAMWKQTMDTLPEHIHVPTLEELKKQDHQWMEQRSDAEILERMHQHEAVLSDVDMIEILGQENAGNVRFEELKAKIEAFKTDNALVEILPEGLAEPDRGATLARRHTEARFAAPWMVRWEEEIVDRVKARESEIHLQLPEKAVNDAIAAYQKRKGFEISDEQRLSVMHATAESGGVAILEGFAGTGKTTVSDCYSEAFRAQGREMVGTCVSNAAAQKLEHESGMPCASVAMTLSRLKKGTMTLTPNHVLVVDEAGMLDTDQTRKLLAYAQEGGCKVILAGDTMQLQPIGPGSGMSLASMGAERTMLTEIRRQKSQDAKDLAALFYERGHDGDFKPLEKATRSFGETLHKGDEIHQALEALNAVDDYEKKEDARNALVEDYLENETAVTDKLVLCHSRADVHALNLAIREGLQKQSKLDKREFVVTTEANGEHVDLPFAKRDRIRFTDTNRKLGVLNGQQGTIESIREGKAGTFDLVVRMESDIPKDDGRLVKLNTGDYANLAHNFATTVHKAQGAGKRDIFHFAHTGMMNNHSSLVAFTRLTSGNYKLYGSSDDIEMLRMRLAEEKLKSTALGDGIKGHEKKRRLGVKKVSLSMDDHLLVKEAARGLKAKQAEAATRQREREQEKTLDAGFGLA